MKDPETTPECGLKEHAMCRGPQVLKRPGAPAWEAPLMTIRCECSCHGRPRKR
ncbi:hypothetical protein GCM10023335_76570 [Streptomyces siamensis]|uniref:Uncharacterized protein n=1 Tax=Streptomyces siamensis TaxID=1274986 RepID=A0ABP9JII1_9ACTN